MCRLDRSTNLLSSKLNSTYNHYCPNNWQKNEYTLSEHVKTVSKVSIFSRGTIVIQHCLNPPAGILFHSSIMTSRSCWMLDTRCFSTFRLRMPHMCAIGFRSVDILGHSITFILCSKAVGKPFLKGGHHLLLQNVTVHVGIHVSLN